MDGAIDGQVCFHRQSFADPVKPQRSSTTGSMGPLMGTNKAVWGVKLLLTTVLPYQVDCGSFCALLLCASLWMVLPAFGFPSTPNTHPTPLLPTHPLYTSSPILQEMKKTITKTSSVSCVTELVIL